MRQLVAIGFGVSLAVTGCASRALHDGTSDLGGERSTDLATTSATPADLAMASDFSQPPDDQRLTYGCPQTIAAFCTPDRDCVMTLAAASQSSTWCPNGPPTYLLVSCDGRSYVIDSTGMGSQTFVYDNATGALIGIFGDDDDPSNSIECFAGPPQWDGPVPYPFACPGVTPTLLC